MSTEVGPKLPTTAIQEGAGIVWYFENEILTINGAYMSITMNEDGSSDSAFIVLGGFDLSEIPDANLIVGMEIEINGFTYYPEPP